VSRHGGKSRVAAFLVGFVTLLAIGRLPAVRMALPDGLGRVEGQGAAGAVVFILPHMASCKLFVPGLILGPGAGATCGSKGITTDAVLRLPRKANCTNIPWCTYADPGVASVGHKEISPTAACPGAGPSGSASAA